LPNTLEGRAEWTLLAFTDGEFEAWVEIVTGGFSAYEVYELSKMFSDGAA